MSARHHLSDYGLRVAMPLAAALALGALVWVPASRVLVQAETRKAVFLQRERYLEDGGPILRPELERAGLPNLPGVVLDSVAAEPTGWYVRFSHRLSPARCEYRGSGIDGRIRCRT